METQETISRWAKETFGDVSSNLSIAVRANKEMEELLMCLAVNDLDAHAIEECADIVIVLFRLVDRNGYDLSKAIDDKMKINRARTWSLDGHGHGYHR